MSLRGGTFVFQNKVSQREEHCASRYQVPDRTLTGLNGGKPDRSEGGINDEEFLLR